MQLGSTTKKLKKLACINWWTFFDNLLIDEHGTTVEGWIKLLYLH